MAQVQVEQYPWWEITVAQGCGVNRAAYQQRLARIAESKTFVVPGERGVCIGIRETWFSKVMEIVWGWR